MPVFRSGKGRAPAWCEMECFDIVRLKPGDSHRFERAGRSEKLLVATGKCLLRTGGHLAEAGKGASFDLSGPEGLFEVTDVLEATTLVRLAGRWGDETGGAGLFTVEAIDKRTEGGVPVGYHKNTAFDNHYHDCDEYWIVYEGEGVVISEGKRFEVRAGDCVATGMGHHHDFTEVVSPVKAVYFETALEGQKRPGHLWMHKHGRPEPKADRV